MALIHLKIEEVTATTDDAMSIASVVQEAYTNDISPRSTALDEKSWDIYEALREKRYDAFLVFSNSQSVATVRWQFEDDALYFSRLAVRPSFQRQGIASLLLKNLEELAIEAGAEKLKCSVRLKEPGNVALYKKLGFILVGERSVCRDGTEVPTGDFEKELKK
jgi:ribosomal protein S18 acetylase RimI-like enzyme